MSEETETMLDIEYKDSFSYLTEDGDLMLNKTSLFAERKIAEVTDEDSLSEIVDECRDTFDQLKDKVNTLVEEDEVSSDAIDDLIKELKSAKAIGDYEALYKQLTKLKEQLDQPETGQEEEEQVESTDEAEEQQAEQAPEAEEPAEEEPTGIGYYEELVEKAESLSKQSDWPYIDMELDNLANKWDEGPEAEAEELKELLGQFQDAREHFEQRKEEHYEQLNKQKKQNLEKKKELLEKLTEIVENKQWTATQKVSSLKGQWNSVGILPSGTGDELEEKFNAQLKEFDEHKVDRLVNKRQQEEDNLTGKLIVLDKMENLADSINDDTSDWKAVDKEFEDLTKQYKRIGRVPAEKSDEVWGRYKSAQDKYYDKKYKHDKKHRQKFDKHFQKKEDLCKKAEALLEEDNLPRAAKELNKLHRRWKKTGNLPQRDEDKLWARFKAATDSFNEYKSNHIDELRDQEEANYNKKVELIEKAREINDTSDWDKGHSKMQSLLDQWKKVGPVPRNKSRKLWKQFKEAQDVFYERRREHFKDRKEQQKENLKEKEEILDKLRELGKHDDPIEAVEQAKPLQEKFKEAGYVPIKKKNEIWKRYREACDVIYERFRAAKSGNKFDQELAKADLDPDQRSKIMGIRKKYKKVEHEMKELKEEVLQYKESKTYFKSSDDDNPLLNEIQSKIDKVENKLQKKRDKLDELDDEIDDIRRQN